MSNKPTEPDEVEEDLTVLEPTGNYASDRHLLLHEIKTLSKEIARLRGDTKHLNEVMVPREEVRRRRRVNFILAGFTLVMFSLAAIGLYIQGQRISDTQHDLAQANYEKCVSDQERAAGQGKAVVEINALLATLRDAQTALSGRPDATIPGRQTATKQAAAYNRYLNFVRESVEAAQARPSQRKPVKCEDLKP